MELDKNRVEAAAFILGITCDELLQALAELAPSTEQPVELPPVGIDLFMHQLHMILIHHGAFCKTVTLPESYALRDMKEAIRPHLTQPVREIVDGEKVIAEIEAVFRPDYNCHNISASEMHMIRPVIKKLSGHYDIWRRG